MDTVFWWVVSPGWYNGIGMGSGPSGEWFQGIVILVDCGPSW